jgi:hypothetical protein
MQLSPEHPITFTLTFGQCQVLLTALNEAPHRVARPLWDLIVRSIETQAAASDQGVEARQPHVKPNGSGQQPTA